MMLDKLLRNVLVCSTVFTVLNASMVCANSIGTINAQDVNVRTSASTDAAIVSKVQSGDVVTVLAHDNGWFKISYPHSEGAYVSSEFVSITEAKATVNSDNVNVRAVPSKEADVITKLNLGEAISVKGLAGEWYSFTHNGGDAFIHKDFVTSDMAGHVASLPATGVSPSEPVYAVVNCSGGLNMRSNPSTEASVITTLHSGSAVDVSEVLNGWVKVKMDDGTQGYLNSEFVTLNKGVKPVLNSKADAIVSYSKQFIGTPYAYAQTDLKSGVDCSGFVYAVFRDNGVALNRSSRDQVRNGSTVDKSQLKPADLVFFSNDGSSGISHVGIYIGDGKFIHSSSGKTSGVIISGLNEAYYVRNYITAARVL